MKKKGFTLIELLAVIVILAIIALIAVPVIISIINKSNKSAFKNTAYGVISAGEIYFAEQQLDLNGMDVEEVTFTFPNAIKGLEFKGKLPEAGQLKVNKEGQTSIAISNGKYCVTKAYSDEDVIIEEDNGNCVIPVKIVNLKFAKETLVAYVGEQTTIIPTIEPSDATNTTLTWTSGNESIVTVENGVLTGVSAGTTTITVSTTDGSNISKTLNVTSKILHQNGIMKSENNCIQSGNKCSEDNIKTDDGIKVIVQVSDTEKQNFYVVSDDGTNLTLMLDRNIGNDIPWISKELYDQAGNSEEEYDDHGSATKGPLSAIAELEEETRNWGNITAKPYTYNGMSSNGAKRIYNDITKTVKARMLTLSEVEATGCTIGFSSCPNWMYENLYTDNTPSLMDGYWLSTPTAAGSRIVFFVLHTGSYNIMSVNSYVNDYYLGVRPVITISK